MRVPGDDEVKVHWEAAEVSVRRRTPAGAKVVGKSDSLVEEASAQVSTDVEVVRMKPRPVKLPALLAPHTEAVTAGAPAARLTSGRDVSSLSSAR
jgi:hypothetical protein